MANQRNSDEKALVAALRDTLITPNELDTTLEPANVADGLFAIAHAIRRLAAAVEKQRQSEDAAW